MRTYSHYLLTRWFAGCAELGRFERGWLCAGSVAPDLPLVVLGTIHFARSWWDGVPAQQAVVEFQHQYFHDVGWQVAHSMLHSPLPICVLLLLAWSCYRAQRVRWLTFFAIGVLGHFAVDLLTHVDDGPLLLFPFDFVTRFASPVSYWDPSHFGWHFTAVEHVLDLAIVVGIWVRRLGRWRRRLA